MSETQIRKCINEMNAYYDNRSPFHDKYMSYTSNENMEKLLGSLIRLFEKDISGKDVLEIACGTGNWTQVLARRAHSVLATDINTSALKIARRKEYDKTQISFKKVDAYNLDDIKGTFNAAFAADWWSHMPKSMITSFLNGLHRKLKPGSRVLFLDMMQNDELISNESYHDDDGNFIHKRILPDGQQFHVIKNFPKDKELREIISGYASDIEIHENLYLERWLLSYTLL
jgi:ubiquinone/menaquinone biosynthesis C-methylase UbiE